MPYVGVSLHCLRPGGDVALPPSQAWRVMAGPAIAARARAASIATLCNWGTNGVSAFFFPWYVSRYGMHTGFLTFAGICALATVFFWYFVPETKGRSLEQIERMWLSKGGIQS